MKTEETKTPRRFPTPPYTVSISTTMHRPHGGHRFLAWKENDRLYTSNYWTLLKWLKVQGAAIIECVVFFPVRKTTGFVWKTSSGDFQAIAQDGRYALFNNITYALQFVEDVYKRTRKEPQPPKAQTQTPATRRTVAMHAREQALLDSLDNRYVVLVPRRGFEDKRLDPEAHPGWSWYARIRPQGVSLTQAWMLHNQFVDVQDLTPEHCFNILLFLRTERAKGSEALEHWTGGMADSAREYVRNKALRWALEQAEKETT